MLEMDPEILEILLDYMLALRIVDYLISTNSLRLMMDIVGSNAFKREIKKLENIMLLSMCNLDGQLNSGLCKEHL